MSRYPAPAPVHDFVLLFLPPCGPHLTPLATRSLESGLLVSPLLGGPARLRPFAPTLHLHQRKSSRNLHLQYSAKSQSTPRCQSLITARSDHPLVLGGSGPHPRHAPSLPSWPDLCGACRSAASSAPVRDLAMQPRSRSARGRCSPRPWRRWTSAVARQAAQASAWDDGSRGSTRRGVEDADAESSFIAAGPAPPTDLLPVVLASPVGLLHTVPEPSSSEAPASPASVGYFSDTRINLQARGYRCCFHLRVF
jgi:hypothetical protein